MFYKFVSLVVDISVDGCGLDAWHYWSYPSYLDFPIYY